MTIFEWIAGVAGAALVAWGLVELLRWRGRRRDPAAHGAQDGAPKPERRSDAHNRISAGKLRRPDDAGPVTDLRSTVAASHDADEFVADSAHLLDQLVDIRDQCGAEEAVLWRWDQTRDALTPEIWSTPDVSRPQHFDMQAWGPLTRWAAEGEITALDDDAGDTAPPRFAAAPIRDDTLLLGVLTLTHPQGLGMSRARAKEWMPRYAAQILRLLVLSEARRETVRQMRQSRALLAAVRQIQTNNTRDSLEGAICDTALQVTSARLAVLVRWRNEQQKGFVRRATREFRGMVPGPVDEDTLVANACRDGMVVFVDDATRLAEGTSLFYRGDGGWHRGSLGIVPVMREREVMGAIVVAADESGNITEDEVRNLGILGAVSATPLQIVWDIDEVTRRARTDALTGLSNRRAFDEQLKRLLNETDRFGQPLALIVADIDHFKRVNDTWGHEAGDEVLRRVAKVLVDGVRTVDVVARYGGEEFGILLPQTSARGAADLADRLRHAIAAKPVKFKGEELSVTASFGVASYPDTVAARDGLFRAADRALYEAKNAGRNCVRAVGVSPEPA